MKYKDISRIFSLNDLVKFVVLTTSGFCVFLLVFGIIMIITGSEIPFTYNGEKVTGMKALMVYLFFIPFYFIIIVIIQLFVLGIGTWVSKLFFRKVKNK